MALAWKEKSPAACDRAFAVLAWGRSPGRPCRVPDRAASAAWAADAIADYSAATIETVCLFNAPLKPN